MESNKIIRKKLPLALLDINDGQIEGLPRNPRAWTITDIEHLKASIEQTPQLLEARGIIVYPYNGRFVAIGGNLRLTALQSLGRENVPCIVLPEDTSIDTLREIAIKDNGSFGEWDEQLLIDDWSGTPFDEWGVRLLDWGSDENEGSKDSRPNDDDGKEVFEVAFAADEFDFVNDRLRNIDDDKAKALLILINTAQAGSDNGEEVK